MTPNDIMSEIPGLLTSSVVIRYGLEFEFTLEVKAGLHVYPQVKQSNAYEDSPDYRGKRFFVGDRNVIWATINVNRRTAKSDFLAINGKGRNWTEAMRDFRRNCGKIGKKKARAAK